MDYGAYLITNAASQNMLAQRVRASNMANVNTAGHKADYLWNTQRPFLKTLAAGEEPNLKESRVGVYANAQGSRLNQGTLVPTGRDLDIALTTEGWFAIELASGEEVYTRNGNFRVTHMGDLVTADGYPVMGHDGPINIPEIVRLEFAENGEITGILDGGEIVQLGRLRLVNPPPNQIEKGEDGFFHYADNKYIRYEPYAKVISGSLESSNVQIIEEMLDYLSMAKQFEIQIKSLMSFDNIAARGSELIKGGR